MKRNLFVLSMILCALLLALGCSVPNAVSGGSGGGSSSSPSGGSSTPSAPAAPVLTTASNQLSVSWTAVTGATSYELWYNTSNDSSSATKFGSDVTGTTATITGLTNDTTYYVWVKAKNSVGTSGFSSSTNAKPIAPTTAPDAPAAPVLTHGNNQLTVTWTAVNGATSYEVWYYTGDDSSSASKFGSDVTGTTATITGLTNGTTYYVWLKAKNAIGTSGFGASANKLLAPNIPSYPTLTSGLGQITATWTAVTGATAYELWYNTSNDTTSATKFASDFTGTTGTITGLSYGTIYYIWVKAKNATGTNGFSPSTLNYIYTTISIGEIAAGNGSYINGSRISYGKTFSSVPKIVVNAYDSGGYPLVAGVRTETGYAADTTGFTVRMVDLDGNDVTSAATVQWIAINPNFSAKVQVQAKTFSHLYDGDYVSFDNAFTLQGSQTVHIVCCGYQTATLQPLTAAAHTVTSTGFYVGLRDCYGDKEEGVFTYIALVPTYPTAITNYYEEASIISYFNTYNNGGSVIFNLTRMPSAVLCSGYKYETDYTLYVSAAKNTTQYGFNQILYKYGGTAGTSVWTNWIAIGIK
jgi:Fibronectin type III domain